MNSDFWQILAALTDLAPDQPDQPEQPDECSFADAPSASVDLGPKLDVHDKILSKQNYLVGNVRYLLQGLADKIELAS